MKQGAKLISLVSISSIALGTIAFAEIDNTCKIEPGVCYTAEDCACLSCLGPSNIGVNASVRPKTCDGDSTLSLAILWWNLRQEGLDLAIKNSVKAPPGLNPPASEIQELNNLIEAHYEEPDFRYRLGFEFAVVYSSPCDGWDLGLYLTMFQGAAFTHIEAEPDDNISLLPLWSALAPIEGNTLYATDIESRWVNKYRFVNIAFGREYWLSQYLSFRPHFGLRIPLQLRDLMTTHYRGGSWNDHTNSAGPYQPANGRQNISSLYQGIGITGGFDTIWNMNCGFALFSQFTTGILYSRFTLTHRESLTAAASSGNTVSLKQRTKESMRVPLPLMDLSLGIQWSAIFSDCKYAFTGMVGWDQRVIFNYNQYWRVVRKGDTSIAAEGFSTNNTGRDVYHQRRGNLSLSGLTFKAMVDF